MSQFSTIIAIVLPIFLVISCGFVIKKIGLIKEETITGFSRLVFYVGLPCLLFKKIGVLDLAQIINLKLIISANLITLALVFLLILLVVLKRWPPAVQGVFIQGAYRSNMAFVGLAVVFNAFGEKGLALGAFFLAFLIPLYNVLAVISLLYPHHGGINRATLMRLGSSIAKNPLIIGAMAGLVFSTLGLKLPKVLDTSINMVGQCALPLALVSVGGSFDFETFKKGLKKSGLIALIKLIIYPAASLLVFRQLGINDFDLKVAVMMFATPTAIASYVMAREMQGDRDLAAAIVMVTTFFSMFTLMGWLFVLGVGK